MNAVDYENDTHAVCLMLVVGIPLRYQNEW